MKYLPIAGTNIANIPTSLGNHIYPDTFRNITNTHEDASKSKKMHKHEKTPKMKAYKKTTTSTSYI